MNQQDASVEPNRSAISALVYRLQARLPRLSLSPWQVIIWLAAAVILVQLYAAYSSLSGTSFAQSGFPLPFIGPDMVEAADGTIPPPPPPPALELARFFFPLALLAAGLPWLATSPALAGRKQRLIAAGGISFLATGLFFLSADLLFLPRLLGLNIPGAVSRLVAMAWPALALLVTLALAAGRRLRPLWRICLVGGLGGSLLLICLAYPAYTLAYTALVSATIYTGPLHYWTAASGLLAGLVVLALIGPLAAYYGRATRPGLAGALAGAIAALVVFAGLGAPLAGMLVHAALYPIVLAPSGSGLGADVLKLLVAFNAALPVIYGMFWLLLGGGIAIGGLTGRLNLFRPAVSLSGSGPAPAPIFWPLALPVANFYLLLLVVFNATLMNYVVAENVQKYLVGQYGYLPAWPPGWTMVLNVAQPWLAFALVQIVGLRWLARARPALATARPLLRLVQLNGLLSLLAWPLLLYTVKPDWFSEPAPLAALLATGTVGLEYLRFSRRRSGFARPARTSPALARAAWSAAGAAAGAVTGVMAALPVAGLVNPIFLGVTIARKFSDFMVVPAGPAGIERITAPLFVMQFVTFVVIVAWLAAGGALFGLAAWLASRLWAASLRPFLLSIRPGCLASLLTVLGGLALLLGRAWASGEEDMQVGFVICLYLLLALALLFIPSWSFRWLLAALLGTTAFTAAVGYARGDGWFVLFSLLFTAGLTLVQPRFTGRWSPGSTARAALVDLGWGLLAAGLVYAWAGPAYALCALVGALGWSALQPPVLKWLGRPGIVLAFGLLFAGLAGVILAKPYGFLLETLPGWPAPLALLGLAAVAGYRLMMRYTPLTWRLSALAVAPLLVGLIAYSQQDKLDLRGGVSRYDPEQGQWQQFSPNNSGLAGALNYELFADSRGRLWFGAGTGWLACYSQEEGWHTYDIPQADKIEEEVSETRLKGDGLLMLEDRQGRLWLAGQAIFGRFDPALSEDNFQGLAGSEGDDLRLPVIGMALDQAGNLWLVTARQGVLRLEQEMLAQDFGSFINAEPEKGFSADERVILAGRSGDLWLGTAAGLRRFRGSGWQDTGLADPVTALLEDSTGRLWVGIESGGYRQADETWIPFAGAGWPNGLGVDLLFEDSQGGLWAGTAAGALRFGGDRWATPIPDRFITTLAEGPPGTIWLGTRQGLVRYDLASGEQHLFTPANSALAAGWVRDVYVEPEGRVWVSTFETGTTPRSPWWAITAATVFVGALFARTYRGYTQ